MSCGHVAPICPSPIWGSNAISGQDLYPHYSKSYVLYPIAVGFMHAKNSREEGVETILRESAPQTKIEHILCRVWKLPDEIGFFPEEWKKLEKRCFFQFLPEESGRNWKKYM